MATAVSQVWMRYAKYIMAGTLSGAAFGVLSGPLAMICFIALESYRHHIDPTGFELLVAPVFGVLCGAAEGAVFGVLWARGVPSRPRFKISHLIGLVLISALVMGFFVLRPQLAALVVLNGLILLPIAALVMESLRFGEQDQDRRGPSRRVRSSSGGPAECGNDGQSPRV
jgi:hypothetical protein